MTYNGDKVSWEPLTVSGIGLVLSHLYVQDPIPENGVELPRTALRTALRTAHSIKEGRLRTTSAPDGFRNPEARRNTLNAVRIMMETSNINGRAKTGKDGLVTSTGRHTPDNGSYTKFCAGLVGIFVSRFQPKLIYH